MSTTQPTPQATADKPPMPAHDYALQWADDTLSGRIDGTQFEWGERNLALSYRHAIATLRRLNEALDAMWNGGSSDGLVRAVCAVQQECKPWVSGT